MVYATEETPLGTAGSVLNARDELDERFLVISGDVLTDIDLGRGRRLPRGEGRARHPGAALGARPRRVRHRDHPRGRLDRALLGEADLGPGLQRHHQHRDLRARAGDLRLHPDRGSLGLLRATSSRPCSAAGRPIYGYVLGGLLGGRRDDRGLPQGAQRRPRPQGPRRDRRLPAATRGVARQGLDRRPERPGRGARRSSATTARSAPGRSSASTRRSGTTSGSPTPPRSRHSIARRQLLRRGRRPGRGGGGRPGPATCGSTPAASPARSSARTA